MAPETIQNIALTGFMAVGKSAVARALAKKLKRRFVDLDAAIEKSAAMKVRDIFAQKGEAYFRALEKKVLAEILAGNGQVIATGGGVVIDEENLRLLREKSVLVCLTASVDTIIKRAGNGAKRPLLRDHDKRARIEELLQAREKHYSQAHAAVDTSDLTVDQVAQKIIGILDSLHNSRCER